MYLYALRLALFVPILLGLASSFSAEAATKCEWSFAPNLATAFDTYLADGDTLKLSAAVNRATKQSATLVDTAVADAPQDALDRLFCTNVALALFRSTYLAVERDLVQSLRGSDARATLSALVALRAIQRYIDRTSSYTREGRIGGTLSTDIPRVQKGLDTLLATVKARHADNVILPLTSTRPASTVYRAVAWTEAGYDIHEFFESDGSLEEGRASIKFADVRATSVGASTLFVPAQRIKMLETSVARFYGIRLEEGQPDVYRLTFQNVSVPIDFVVAGNLSATAIQKGIGAFFELFTTVSPHARYVAYEQPGRTEETKSAKISGEASTYNGVGAELLNKLACYRFPDDNDGHVYRQPWPSAGNKLKTLGRKEHVKVLEILGESHGERGLGTIIEKGEIAAWAKIQYDAIGQADSSEDTGWFPIAKRKAKTIFLRLSEQACK